MSDEYDDDDATKNEAIPRKVRTLIGKMRREYEDAIDELKGEISDMKKGMKSTTSASDEIRQLEKKISDLESSTSSKRKSGERMITVDGKEMSESEYFAMAAKERGIETDDDDGEEDEKGDDTVGNNTYEDSMNIIANVAKIIKDKNRKASESDATKSAARIYANALAMHKGDMDKAIIELAVEEHQSGEKSAISLQRVVNSFPNLKTDFEFELEDLEAPEDKKEDESEEDAGEETTDDGIEDDAPVEGLIEAVPAAAKPLVKVRGASKTPPKNPPPADQKKQANAKIDELERAANMRAIGSEDFI